MDLTIVTDAAGDAKSVEVATTKGAVQEGTAQFSNQLYVRF